MFLFFDNENDLLFLASKDTRYEIDTFYHNSDETTQKWIDNHKRLIPLYKQIYPNGYVHPSIIDNKLFILPKEDQSYIVITPHNKTVDIKIEDKTYKNIKWANLKEQLQNLS